MAFNITPIPRIQKASVDLLATVCSKIIHLEQFSLDIFSIALIFHPSIPKNITNW